MAIKYDEMIEAKKAELDRLEKKIIDLKPQVDAKIK